MKALTASPIRPFSASTKRLFALPARLFAAGWSETQAPFSWKTGIRIKQEFWNHPLQPDIRVSQGTVRRLNDREIKAVEAEVARSA